MKRFFCTAAMSLSMLSGVGVWGAPGTGEANQFPPGPPPDELQLEPPMGPPPENRMAAGGNAERRRGPGDGEFRRPGGERRGPMAMAEPVDATELRAAVQAYRAERSAENRTGLENALKNYLAKDTENKRKMLQKMLDELDARQQERYDKMLSRLTADPNDATSQKSQQPGTEKSAPPAADATASAAQ